MKVRELLKLNSVDKFRFYEYSDTMDPSFIDEYTPYKAKYNINLDREVYSFATTIVFGCGEYEDDFISVILKEEENA